MPFDTDNSSLRIWMIFYGVLVPALTSTVVLLVSWPLWRRTMASWPLAAAVGLGYAVGHIGIEGWRPFPPREAADRLWYLVLAAVVFAFLDDWRSCPRWLRWMPRAVLWLAVVWFLLPPSIRQQANRLEAGAWLTGLGLSGLIFWGVLAFAAHRLPGALLPLILLIVSLCSAAVLYAGHSLKLTQLAGVFAATLLPILLRAACNPPMVLAMAPVVVILPGLWLISSFYSYEPPPLTTLLLLAAAALSGSLGLLPGIRKWAGWQRGLLCGLAALLLACGAVAVAQGMRTEDDDLLLSRPHMRGVTINTIE